ncbi:AAA family ATPase [Colletotrichum asianum]
MAESEKPIVFTRPFKTLSHFATTKAVVDNEMQSPVQISASIYSPEKRDTSQGRVSNIDKTTAQADLDDSKEEDDEETHPDMGTSKTLQSLRVLLKSSASSFKSQSLKY